jgi:hypothetical protein
VYCLNTFWQALVETPSAQSSQKRAELLEEQRVQMEEKKRMKEEAARIARQQEFEEEERLEVMSPCLATCFLCDIFDFSENAKSSSGNMKRNKVRIHSCRCIHCNI